MSEPIKQPEALRLADALAERRVTQWVHSTGEMPRADGYRVDVECFEAAIELRRLHVEVERLRADHATLLDNASIEVRRLRAESNKMEAEIERLRAALEYAVSQNEHDMLLTGEECRTARNALKEPK